MGANDGHLKNLKEEFFAHPDAVSETNLLELLLLYCTRKDTNPVAHQLIQQFGSLNGVLDALPDELLKVPDVGKNALPLLKVVKEIAGRYTTVRARQNGIVDSTEKARQILKPYLFGVREEHAYLLCMGRDGKLFGTREVGTGSIQSVQISTRRVLEIALALNAERVILAHNHVSNTAQPSADDVHVTEHLFRVLQTVHIVLDDHLIFAKDEILSMRESGFFENLK